MRGEDIEGDEERRQEGERGEAPARHRPRAGRASKSVEDFEKWRSKLSVMKIIHVSKLFALWSLI